MIRSLLLMLCISLGAVEVPARILSTTDGDTVTVETQATSQRVRLLYVDTPESRDNAHGPAMAEGKTASEYTRKLLPIGTQVKLWGPGSELEKDRYGRILAILVLPDGLSAQECLIRDGHSPYWRKYGSAPSPWNEKFLKAHDAAKAAKTGIWGLNSKWMTDKSNERTTPGTPMPVSHKESPAPTGNTAQEYWLNTSSGVRHNQNCKNFKKTARGRLCSATDGKPCGQCGG